MPDPYRDQPLRCPACAATLRAFRSRLICDACGGIFLTPDDLAGGIHDLTSITPTFEYHDEKPGKRACPACAAAMTRCRLRIHLDDDVEKPKPELDRCAVHGIWFDDEELARVFERVTGKGYGGGVGRKIVDGPRKGEVDHGRWSAVWKGVGHWGGGS